MSLLLMNLPRSAEASLVSRSVSTFLVACEREAEMEGCNKLGRFFFLLVLYQGVWNFISLISSRVASEDKARESEEMA
jgi:hypothetical protein